MNFTSQSQYPLRPGLILNRSIDVAAGDLPQDLCELFRPHAWHDPVNIGMGAGGWGGGLLWHPERRADPVAFLRSLPPPRSTTPVIVG